ncbi:LEA type 2 family protein [Spirosoma sp. KCTC 42546]|uniref:LEA type 2 family protein n=1 Tax=Spirosoma sp. KCTC 42546 TaxID=2520506 RepID=UPI00115C34E6|nr:LEA type 2 family protein [Spirosoma sp. KCTC 42546]QDK82020.1 LEA type 2 family protein [Spirosoma sp. KCTC 42546]
MKKGWIIALALLLLGALGAYIWYSRLKHEAAAEGGAYDNTLKPRLEMTRFAITDISEDTVRMNLYMLIDNPLPVGFKSPNMDYTFYIANTPVMVDAYKKPIEVKAGDSTVVMLPAKLLLKKLTKVLETLDRKDIDSTNYKMRTKFALDIPILGQKTFETTVDKRMPTFYLPKVKIDDIDFGKLGLKRTDIAAKVSITNRNKFPFNITDAHYTVTIAGKTIADGYQPEPILIKAQSTTPVIFPVTARPGKTLSVLPKMLFDKKDTPYEVKFRSKLIDPKNNPMIQHSKFVSTITGTLDDFKKLKK